MLTLARNRQWWTTGPLLSPDQRVGFPGSGLVWEYYPGQGIEIQWLGTFGAANGLYDERQYDALAALLDQAVGLAAVRGGGIAWEYDFSFDGGARRGSARSPRGPRCRRSPQPGTVLIDARLPRRRAPGARHLHAAAAGRDPLADQRRRALPDLQLRAARVRDQRLHPVAGRAVRLRDHRRPARRDAVSRRQRPGAARPAAATTPATGRCMTSTASRL